MALIDKIFGRNRTLSDLTPLELRREEILIGKQRDRLFGRIQKLADAKQKIFQSGARERSPELRKAMAVDFEMKTQEQLLAARELNVRSKELLTVSRLRLVKESQGRGAALGRLKLTERDVGRITQWMEDDGITQDMYRERLDRLLEIGAATDRDALEAAGLSAAGQELMHVWAEMDRGSIKADSAFEQADRAVRQRVAPPES